MAQTTYIRKRLTHRYVGTYAHLDDWSESVKVKELAHQVVALSEDFDEGDTVRFGVVVPKSIPVKDALDMLYSTYNSHGCAHEYDCCGCPSYHADIKPVKRGFFSVLVKTSYNY